MMNPIKRKIDRVFPAEHLGFVEEVDYDTDSQVTCEKYSLAQ
jgi:hypothetical protein